MTSSSVIKLERICKSYNISDAFVLKNVSLSIKKDEFVTLLGPSGSGKSTLLHICGLLDSPNSGNIYICGKHIDNISDEERSEKKDYLTIMRENLELIKKELYQ